MSKKKDKKNSGKLARKTASNHAQFVDEYLANGRNASAAYRKLHPRASERTGSVNGARLLANTSVQAILAEREKALIERAGLRLEDTLRQLKCVQNFDLRKLYREDGTLKAPHELDDDTAVALGSVETEELFEGKGDAREHVGKLRKVKAFDKIRAIDMAMKHFGQYEIDNKQKPGVTLIVSDLDEKI